VFIAFSIGCAHSKSMSSHSKLMLLGFLPMITLSTLLACGTMQQQSALVFGVTHEDASFYDVYITTENGVERFAADYRKISGDYPSDTVVIQNTNPRTSPNIVLKQGQWTEIRFDCKNDDCLVNNYDRWKANLVPLDTSDKTIVDGNPPVVSTIVENHYCDWPPDEACALTFDFRSGNLKTGYYLLVVVATVDEFTSYFINEVQVIK
jgi:hypothetical protein